MSALLPRGPALVSPLLSPGLSGKSPPRHKTPSLPACLPPEALQREALFPGDPLRVESVRQEPVAMSGKPADLESAGLGTEAE